MGQIVDAAITPQHPAIVRSEADRLMLGDGHDTDLVPGFARVREKMDALDADTLIIFDTHWISTSMNLVAGLAHYKGIYTSDELPHVLAGVEYDYPGAPELAARYEGWGSHYFQMIGALGGRDCRLTGTPMSEYENARGTGNILIWFDVPGVEQQAA